VTLSSSARRINDPAMRKRLQPAHLRMSARRVSYQRAIGRIVMFLVLALPVRAGQETFYLGTFTHAPGGSQGIYVGTLDSRTGKLGPLRLAAKETDPNFLALSPNHRFIFAALNDAAETFAIQLDGTLRALNQQPSGGGDTCHISVDRTGHEIFVASYASGSVAGFPVATDGTIGPRVAFEVFSGSGPNKLRQQSPHAHSIYADPQNRFVYACDLGTDNIWIYRRDQNGDLVPAHPLSVKTPPGSGPRHLVFDGVFVYLVNEMGVTTCVFQRDQKTGALRLLETVDNIQGGAGPDTGSAEIALHPSGAWLYISTRVQDVMTVFRVDRNASKQRLALIQNIPSPVMFPRSFGLDPSGRWMIVAGQNDNRISVMKIDPSSGLLAPTPEFESVGSPVCVLFMPPATP
jgi:6-phosphogluconolactonase